MWSRFQILQVDVRWNWVGGCSNDGTRQWELKIQKRENAEESEEEGDCKEIELESRSRSSNTRHIVIERNCTGG